MADFPEGRLWSEDGVDVQAHGPGRTMSITNSACVIEPNAALIIAVELDDGVAEVRT